MNWNISWILSPYPSTSLKVSIIVVFTYILPECFLCLYTHISTYKTVFCCFSVIQSCLTLCEPMDCSTPVNSWTAVCQASLSFTISESFLKLMSIELVIPFNHLIFYHPLSSCFQSFPASGSFPMNWLFASGGQSFGASVSTTVFPINIQDWLPLGLTGLISMLSKGLLRIFSNTTVWKYQFFGT